MPAGLKNATIFLRTLRSRGGVNQCARWYDSVTIKLYWNPECSWYCSHHDNAASKPHCNGCILCAFNGAVCTAHVRLMRLINEATPHQHNVVHLWHLSTSAQLTVVSCSAWVPLLYLMTCVLKNSRIILSSSTTINLEPWNLRIVCNANGSNFSSLILLHNPGSCLIQPHRKLVGQRHLSWNDFCCCRSWFTHS
jgi:hypothetical protein